ARTAATTRATPSTGRTIAPAPPTASRASAPRRRVTASPTRACSTRWTSSATASSCRSSPCSPASCSSRSPTASRSGRCCPRARGRWSCTGPTSASRTTTRPCGAAASSRRTWWAPRATCRWRTAAWAASCSGESRPRATCSRWSTWAARAPSRRRRGPPRPRCAGSGRRTAAAWACDVLAVADRVAQLNAAYARAIDDDRLEQWPALFTDPCLYKITSADNYRRGLPAGLVYADSRGMLEDRVAALREANIYERQAYRHVVGLPSLDAGTDGAVHAETPFLVVRVMRDGSMDLFATGRYVDLMVEEGGTLRFRERVVVCDSSRVDTLLAIPL